MQTEHYVLTQTPLAWLAPWQETIDAERWPLRLTGHDGSLLGSCTVRAELKGRPTAFNLEFLSRTDFAERWNFAAVPSSWRFYLRFAGIRSGSYEERIRSAVASVAAACAYGVRSEGVWCTPSLHSPNPQDMLAVRDGLRSTVPIWIEIFIDKPSPPLPGPDRGRESDPGGTVASVLAD